ncbi:18891_t:CDS:2 [Acaulospora morrowiae]|uniref:18891_t:CDS:1 n=1 Tax=Acaulospora morrowiae TaxID=94023 RepID=A0A9N9AJ15_9GLOM|nr:18891_t:CDS:2 [Acaulospora morrowiae]
MNSLDLEKLPDYYKVLEISQTSSSQEIKKAYRKLALKYHPDKNISSVTTDQSEINTRFILINEAYNVLGNDESRGVYDELRRTGKTFSQLKYSSEEYRYHREVQGIHKLYREIMANKEQILELSETFIKSATSLDWIPDGSEVQPFSAFKKYEKEISLIESSILIGSSRSFNDENSKYDEITFEYVPEDDVIQVLENPCWVSIDKDTLIHDFQLSDFVESHKFIIKSVTDIVSPLMMACTYGTWLNDNIMKVLQRVRSLQMQIIKYLEVINQKIEIDGRGFEPKIVDKMKAGIQTQMKSLSNHPILGKMTTGRFGQNKHPFVHLAATIGPPFVGYSLYWSIFAIILLGAVTIHRNEGDLESFNQFLEIFEGIIKLLDQITE